MVEERITIEEYQTEKSKIPYRNWLRSLKDASTRARIRTRINRLRLGNFGDAKSVGEGVSELRLDFGPGYRIYYGRDGDSLVLLLCGSDKKSQNKMIEHAKKYWTDYNKRKKETT